MLTLSGYVVEEKIYESEDSQVYRGHRQTDNKPVIFKILKEEYPSLEKISRFLHEHEILKKLNQEGTVAVYELQKHKNSFVIIMEAIGIDLQKYLTDKYKLPLTEALAIAIEIIESLGKLHKQKIIHKDINPSNILLDRETGKIKFIDFGISTSLPKESSEVSNVSINRLEGTLAYISPEQTGRMNRGIDYRSDYYSLGVTFYQIFTSALPFQSKEPLELVYSHIAKYPSPPHEVDPAIPKIVSDIIMKLLAKTSEERYQSDYGIQSDLRECLLQLQKTGAVQEFSLAKNDLSLRFQVPEKLYGRSEEVKQLLNVFDKVSAHRSELILIAGHSGIGKTSLVQELHKPIVEKKGYFVSGKFDQLKRNIPYAPFVQALSALIQQLLSESADKIQLWRNQLLQALGTNAGVISEIIPSITQITGEQQHMLDLGPTATQNRFILVFEKFIQVLATQEHPLVIFLDDLQWIDLPSIKLLDSLLSQPTIKHLLIIGAYRDNEVSPSHPLMLSLEGFQQKGINIETFTVDPLKVEHIQELLADTMSQKLETMAPLAAICHTKTMGNPFFLNQFLRALYDENLIIFDNEHRNWHWLIDKIRIRPSTDNVVDLVINNIQKLTKETQNLLTHASCIGNRFDLQLLSALSAKNPKETAQMLEESLQYGYILPVDNSYRYVSENPNANVQYQFLHDRVQQAAYLLLTDDEKQDIHLTIARYLLKSFSPEIIEECLFTIVNQFNLGIDHVTDPKEKIQLANLNLKAGKKAKSSAAYTAAFNYATLGIKLLPGNCWESEYQLALNLYTEAAEAAYLCDNFSKSDELVNHVLTSTSDLLSQVKVYEIKIYTAVARNEPANAVEIAMEVLRKLGIKFPKKPKKFHVIMSLLKVKLSLLGKTKEELVNLPTISDPYKQAASDILSATIAPAYFATPLVFPLVTLELLNLSIRYGYNKGAPSCYASYGIILCGILGDIKTGYFFGQLAQELVERFHALDQEAKIALMVNGFILHWKDPYRNTLAPLLAAHLRGIETGDLEYSTYSAYFYMVCSFYAGVELQKIADDMKRFYEFSKYHHTHKPVFYSMLVLGQVVENLLNLSEKPTRLVGRYFNEDNMLQEAIDTNNLFGLYSLYVVKLILNYTFGDFLEAEKAAKTAPKYIQSATGSAPIKVFNFYDSLNHIALAEKSSEEEKLTHIKAVENNQKQMKLWMNFTPDNCAHKYYLVSAELARLLGNKIEAIDFYDKAINLAKHHEFTQEHALANELMAKFYYNQGKEIVANGFMTAAYYSYSKWGAVAKIKQLEETYPNLLTQKQTSGTKYMSLEDLPQSKTSLGQNLDLSTLMKASQTITKEIILSDLLKNLMSFLIENAGAQKGCLLLGKEGKWVIESEIEDNKVHVLHSLPLDDRVPKSVIQYVINGKQSLLLDNASQENQFISDPYIVTRKPKSILAIPLLNQGILSGILYLENNLIPGAFTKERVSLLNLLSAQIVISIENARLYTHMSDLNRAYERFIPKEFLVTLEKKNIIDVQLNDQIQKDMTIMFCDIRNFTAISEKLTPAENFAFVNIFLGQLEPIISQYGGFIDKYIGDSIMAIYPTSTDNALTSAIKMLDVLYKYNQDHPEKAPINIGIGLNSGLLMLGIVGDNHHMEGTVISDVVNVASRTEDLTKKYGAQILITGETYKRLRNPEKYFIRKLGLVLAKGRSQTITIFEIFDNDPESIKFLKRQTKPDFENAVSYFTQKKYDQALKILQEVLKVNPSDKAAQFYLSSCQEHMSELAEPDSHDGSDS